MSTAIASARKTKLVALPIDPGVLAEMSAHNRRQSPEERSALTQAVLAADETAVINARSINRLSRMNAELVAANLNLRERISELNAQLVQRDQELEALRRREE